MPSNQEIEAFLKKNHLAMTAEDLASELIITVSAVAFRCRRLGIKPITVRQKNINFVLANHKEMSATQIGNLLGLNRKSMLQYYANPLGLQFKPEEPGEVEKRPLKKIEIVRPPIIRNEEPERKPNPNSPRAILASFRLNEAHHYHYPEPDPMETIRIKLEEGL